MKLETFHSVCKLLSDADIGTTAAHILAAVSELQKPSMTNLARLCEVSTAAITSSIDRLEAQGYVERYRVAEDRRTILVRLTTKGSRFVALIFNVGAES